MGRSLLVVALVAVAITSFQVNLAARPPARPELRADVAPRSQCAAPTSSAPSTPEPQPSAAPTSSAARAPPAARALRAVPAAPQAERAALAADVLNPWKD